LASFHHASQEFGLLVGLGFGYWCGSYLGAGPEEILTQFNIIGNVFHNLFHSPVFCLMTAVIVSVATVPPLLLLPPLPWLFLVVALACIAMPILSGSVCSLSSLSLFMMGGLFCS